MACKSFLRVQFANLLFFFIENLKSQCNFLTVIKKKKRCLFLFIYLIFIITIPIKCFCVQWIIYLKNCTWKISSSRSQHNLKINCFRVLTKNFFFSEKKISLFFYLSQSINRFQQSTVVYYSRKMQKQFTFCWLSCTVGKTYNKLNFTGRWRKERLIINN